MWIFDSSTLCVASVTILQYLKSLGNKPTHLSTISKDLAKMGIRFNPQTMKVSSAILTLSPETKIRDHIVNPPFETLDQAPAEDAVEIEFGTPVEETPIDSFPVEAIPDRIVWHHVEPIQHCIDCFVARHHGTRQFLRCNRNDLNHNDDLFDADLACRPGLSSHFERKCSVTNPVRAEKLNANPQHERALMLQQAQKRAAAAKAVEKAASGKGKKA